MLANLLNNPRHLFCCYYCFTATSNSLSFVRAITTSQLKEYYAFLNVNRDSTKKEIKESFLKLSKVYHPDNKNTGSHLKFVKLKEAYDAVKDGPPAVSSTYSHYTNQDEDVDLSHRAHTRYREQNRDYTKNPYQKSGNPFNTNKSHGFGGPYAKSKTPWEDLQRDRAYRSHRFRSNMFVKVGSPFMRITILLGAVCWVFIYGAVLLIWDHNEVIKREGLRHKANYDFRQYEEYVRRKESERLFRLSQIEAAKNKLRVERGNKSSDNPSDRHQHETNKDSIDDQKNSHTKKSATSLSLNEIVPPTSHHETDRSKAQPSTQK